MEDQYRVLVLMSSYNGGNFISEQIVSILNQNGVMVELLIRDDGSSDDTLAIIENFIKTNKNISLIKGENLGFIHSFSVLVSKAMTNCTGFDYYAFADQDDLWYKNKLLDSCNALSGLQLTDVPCLYCCNSEIINAHGEKTGRNFISAMPCFTKGNVMFFTTLQGCSMTFNRKAVEMYASFGPVDTLHDRWMFFICNFFGTVIYEHKALFCYRVHESNTIGVKNRAKGFKRLKQSLDYWLHFTPQVNPVAVGSFLNTFRSQLSSESIRLIETYLSYRTNIFAKMNMLFSPLFGPKDSGFVARVAYYVHVIFNKF